MEAATCDKILGHFSPIVPPSAAGVRLRRFRRGGSYNHWSSRLGGLTCRWQRHSVKTSLLRILNDSSAGQNPQGVQCQLKKKIYSIHSSCVMSQTNIHIQVTQRAKLLFSFCGMTAPSGPGPPHCLGFTIALGTTPLDKPNAETW